MSFHIDFETYSDLDLPTVGSFRYSEDPSTEALILSYSDGSFDPIGVDLTLPNAFERLTPLFDAVTRGELICAHNVTFERNIWTKVCKFPVTPKPSQWDCTAVRARLLALPGSLAGASSALGVKAEKDKRGVDLMNIFSKPNKKGRIFPADRPDEFQEYINYCRQDVRVELELDRILPPMPEVEKQAFMLDYEINDRGMPVNMTNVNRAISFVEEYSEVVLKRAVEIAGCRPSQRVKTMDYLASRGFKLPDLQAGTVEKLIKKDGLPEDIRELLDSRIELSRAGTKKLVTIQSTVSTDGRIRGGFLFSAASTRRWSSTGVQMHNLQKPEGVVAPEVVIDLIASDNASDLSLIFPRPLTAVAQSIRGFFESEQSFLVADYSSVEPRGLAWSADEDWLLQAYHRREDAYKIAAGKVFNIEPLAVNSAQRFLGKQLILGCFASDTLVLTDSGWKPLVSVTISDTVWDGLSFVRHTGLIPQGKKEVIDLCHVSVTPNHLILCDQQWTTSLHITTDPSGKLLQSALSSVSLPLKHTDWESVAGLHFMNVDVPVGLSPSNQRGTLTEEKLNGVLVAPLKLQQNNLLDDDVLNPNQSLSENENLRTTKRLSGSGGTCTTGFCKNGQDESTITKSTGLEFVEDGASSVASLKTLSNLRGGGLNPSLIGETTLGITAQRIAGLLTTPKAGRTLVEVYDIGNCGSLNRFTILTSSGPMLVHNCGYGMGPPRFIDSCAKWGVKISEELSETSVSGFRTSVPAIVKFWYDVEAAAIRATKYWKTIKLGRFTFRPATLSNGYKVLFVDMPSGSIAYPDPSVGEYDWYGKTKEKFEFWTPLGSGFVKTDTFGGSLVENIIQAMTRDILRDGMVAANNDGFFIVGHCHDEAIAEGPDSKDDLKEFERLLCTSSPWADNFPIATEGYISKRYRK